MNEFHRLLSKMFRFDNGLPLTGTLTDGRKSDIRGLADSFLEVAGNSK